MRGRPRDGASREQRSTELMRKAGAVLAVFTVLAGLMVVFAVPAEAHHSEIEAGAACDASVTWTARAWNGSTEQQRTNNDVRVWYRVGNVSAPTGKPAGIVTGDVEVAARAFDIANGYSFDGTFPFPAGQTTITVFVQEQGKWGAAENLAGVAQARRTVVTSSTDCPGAPATDAEIECTETGGTVTVTLQNQGGTQNAAFVVKDPTNNALETTKVVKPNESATVTYQNLPDGTYTVPISVTYPGGQPIATSITNLAVACSGDATATAAIECSAEGGTITVTLDNSGGTLPATFEVASPIDEVDVRTVVVPANSTDLVSFTGLDDGTFTVLIVVQYPGGDQLIRTIAGLVVDCAGLAAVDGSAECTADGGVVSLVLSNTAPANSKVVQFAVSGPGASDGPTEVSVAAGQFTTLGFSGVVDGTATYQITADGVALDDEVFEITCDDPDVAGPPVVPPPLPPPGPPGSIPPGGTPLPVGGSAESAPPTGALASSGLPFAVAIVTGLSPDEAAVLGITESRELEPPVAAEPVESVEVVELARSDDPFEEPVPMSDDLSTMSTGIPDDVDFSPLWVAGNAGLGMLVLLLLVAAAQLFNDALKTNHDHLVQQMSSRSSLLGRARMMLAGLPHPPVLVSFGLVAAVLGLLADPSVALSTTTIGQMLGMAIAITLIVGIYDGGASRMIARRTGLAPRYRLYPVAIAVAIGCLALSRVFQVAPGVLYGLFAGVIFTTAVDMKLEGRAYARSSVMLMAAALVGYGVHRLVGSAAAEPSPSLLTIVIDTAAAVVFVGGLQAVIVQLLPTRYVNGEKVASWSRLGWFFLLAGSLGLYLQFVVRPSEGQQSWANLWFVVAFVAFAVVFWAWCAVSHRRRLRTAAAVTTSETADVGV